MLLSGSCAASQVKGALRKIASLESTLAKASTSFQYEPEVEGGGCDKVDAVNRCSVHVARLTQLLGTC